MRAKNKVNIFNYIKKLKLKREMKMASKRFDKNSDEFKFFGEFWKWTQAHYIPEHDDAWWEEALASAAVICNKYKDHKLFPKLMIAVLDYLGEENKRING